MALGKPIVFVVDVEPDSFYIDPRRHVPWSGFERSVKVMERFRHHFQERWQKASHFSWFIRCDPQIEYVYGEAQWAFSRYEQELSQLSNNGDALGLHIHAYRRIDSKDNWIIDHGNQQWVEECLQMGFASFKRGWGEFPKLFRFGDRWMNQKTMEELDRLGCEIDLTVEPGHKEILTYHPGKPYSGSIPDYQKVPVRPYHPDPFNFQLVGKEQKRRIWVFPMSSGFVSESALPVAKRIYYRMTTATFPRQLFCTLRLDAQPNYFADLYNQVTSRDNSPYVSIVVRTDAFLGLKSSYFIHKNLRYLLDREDGQNPLWKLPSQVLKDIESVN